MTTREVLLVGDSADDALPVYWGDCSMEDRKDTLRLAEDLAKDLEGVLDAILRALTRHQGAREQIRAATDHLGTQ